VENLSILNGACLRLFKRAQAARESLNNPTSAQPPDFRALCCVQKSCQNASYDAIFRLAAHPDNQRLHPKKVVQSFPRFSFAELCLGVKDNVRMTGRSPALALSPIRYCIDTHLCEQHLYRIRLHIAQPQAQQQMQLPAWIPGSYLLREFAKHLQSMRAEQNGQPVALTQLDKATWQAANTGDAPLDVYYEVYAFDNSVRTAWLDAQRGFFNPTSLCLQVLGQSQAEHSLELVLSADLAKNGVYAAWAAIKIEEATWAYTFAHYDALADTPFVFAQDLWRGEFTAAGIAHEFVIVGAPPNFDGAKLLADTQGICQAQQDFWGCQPAIFERYVFMLHATEYGYGGLEHMASTALIGARQDLPRQGEHERSKNYQTLLGLISHEYFHSWNVKRLRPAPLARYDYSRESYTELLWFFEGFTSYYDDLFLRRTGLIDEAQYLQLLTKSVQALAATPGAQVQSVAQASFDAWTKYYRPDENSQNATVSYYTKGALVALCLDLTLRSEGRGDLDAVMRLLWGAQPTAIKPISQADIAAALQAVGGRSYAPELQAWVHGTADLPVLPLLAAHGISSHTQAPSWAQRLGLKAKDGKSASASSLKIQAVLRGGCAEAAGLAAGDEWLGVEVDGQIWRVYQLAQLDYLLPAAVQAGQGEFGILYSREQRVYQGRLQLQLAQKPLQELRVQDAALARAWLPSRQQV
jgi:predicted metalloprotease with PDZ domain